MTDMATASGGVMDNKDKEPGLLGVVADIIKVDKDYEIAVETALEEISRTSSLRMRRRQNG